jgi:hypothetical protein
VLTKNPKKPNPTQADSLQIAMIAIIYFGSLLRPEFILSNSERAVKKSTSNPHRRLDLPNYWFPFLDITPGPNR